MHGYRVVMAGDGGYGH